MSDDNKTDELDLFELKNLEKIFANNVSAKGSKHKDPILKQAKDLNRHFAEENIEIWSIST